MNFDLDDDEIDVKDVVFMDTAGRSTSSKYLVSKIRGRLSRLQKDRNIWTSEVTKLKERVHQRVNESEKAAERTFEVG